MALNQTAAATVFAIPELLDIIFYHVYEPADFRPLEDIDYNARQSAGLLRVNSVCHSLAARHTWRNCGLRDGCPSLYDFVKMAEDKERLQWYANFIEHLHIDGEIDRRGVWRAPEEIQGVRARLNLLLPDLSFPRLRSLTLVDWAPTATSEFEDGDGREIYFNAPQLDELVLLSVLEEVTTNCYKVQAFCKFLDSTATLATLRIWGSEDLWSCETFIHIARNRNLSQLDFGMVSNLVNKDWMEITSRVVTSPFESLKKLQVLITDDGWDLLLPYISNVTDLRVRLADKISANHLTSLCCLSSLKKVRIDSRDDGELGGEIDGEALVQMAKHCPMLISIEIGESKQRSLGRTVSDSVIEKVAQSLPKLESFSLLGGFSKMTEHSILHFGQYCKALRWLTISAVPSFVELAYSGSAGMFHKLEKLDICDYRRPEQFRVRSYEEIEEIAMRIARMMPKCERFSSNNAYGYVFVQGERLYLDNEVLRALRTLRKENSQADRHITASTS
ncbi:hypothetical protein MMC10_004035 [Thelotrema lepadinum]|nr:hypothetical protein [Thelotrema lepadinum]